MAVLRFGNKRLRSTGGFISIGVPSEIPALNKLQNFWVSINAYIVDYDELPPDQNELEAYMNLDPDGAYTFSYTEVVNGLGYLNATSSSPYIHSYTRTVTYDGYGLQNIICKKLGTTAPGVADYTGGVLSCQLGTEEA
jgi:hypothetical protein